MVVGQLTLGMAEYQLAHLPGRQRIVVLVHHSEFHICHGLSHRADLPHVVHQHAGRNHRSEPVEDAYTGAALELFPGTWWGAGVQHDAHRMVLIVGTWRLFEQDGDHAAQGIELHRVVLAALVEETRRAEAFPEGEPRVK